MNYVASSSANGSIGYVEYSFALSVNYPVAKVLNSAGYYTCRRSTTWRSPWRTGPDQHGSELPGLPPAEPHQRLHRPRSADLPTVVVRLHDRADRGTILPTNDPSETTAKRQSIADFEYYSICQGQKEIGPIGYSPLPVNLVEAGFGQIQKLQQADPNVDLTNLNINTCNNPTFVPGQPNTNYLAHHRAATAGL
jgi:phosphate transport system substrate-binding protein